MNVSKTRRTLRTAVTALAGSALLLGMAACGADKSGSSNGVLKEDFLVTMEQWRADVDGCMLNAGFDLGEPTEPLDMSKFDTSDFNAAYTACIEKVGEAPVDESAPDEDEIFEIQLVFAKCMRDAGYDYPDPTKGGMSPAFGPETDPNVLDGCSEKANEAVMGK